MTEATTIALADLPPLKASLGEGNFGGVITLPDGRHCAVVLLSDRPAKLLAWKEAMEWAQSVGGQLVSPAIALLLYTNCPDLLPQTWVWTDRPEGSSDAWFCDFGNVYVFSGSRSAEGGAIAVRLIPITT